MDKEELRERINDVESVLYSYREYGEQIKELKARLQELDQSDGLKGIDYSAVRTGKTNRFSSTTEFEALNGIDLKEKLERQIKLCELRMQRILVSLEVLNATDKTIIRKHYLEGVPIKNIEYLVGYSGGQCIKRKQKALVELSRILKA